MTCKRAFKIPFSGVGMRYTQEEKQAVLTAMDATTTLTQGDYQARFQQAFAKFIGVPYAFAVSSCTAALELAAILFKLKPGDEVICPAHTYCATAYPFARHGVKMVWADIDLDTLVVTAETIKPLITEKTKAIIVVHLYGNMANMPAIADLARENNIYLIEDCAQSIGAKINNKMAGSFGDASTFSFHTHKNMTTLGEGGMLCVRDDEWAKVVPGLRHNGQRAYPEDRKYYWHPAMVNVDFDWEGVWPHNFCVGEVQCAVGIEVLKRVPEMNAERKARFLYIKNLLAKYPEIVFQEIEPNVESAYHLLPFRYDGKKYGCTNHDFIEQLVNEYGIQAIVQYYPLNRYPLFSKAGFGAASVPNTDYFFDNMVSVPFHHWLSDEEFKYIAESIGRTAEHLRNRMAVKMA